MQSGTAIKVITDIDVDGTILIGSGKSITIIGGANPAGNSSGTAIRFTKGNLVVAANGFSRRGFVFAGWNTAADGSGTSYQAGDAIVLQGDTTLYAQWQVPEPEPGSEPAAESATKPEPAARRAAQVVAGKQAIPQTGDSTGAVPVASGLIVGALAALGARVRRRML